MDLPDHILELIKLLFYQFQNLITVKLVYNESGLNEIDSITNKLKNLSDNSVILC